MPLVNLLLVIAVIGVVLYLFNKLVVMDDKFKQVINVIAYLILFIVVIETLVPYIANFTIIHGR